MLRIQIARYARWLLAVFVLMAAAVVAGGYILLQQRLTPPFQERYTVNAEFDSSNGINPGLGQAVNVAGVKVGTISAASLRDGRSIVALEIDPDKLPYVRRNASAVLVPNTPLKDMQVELFPGRPPAPPLRSGATISAARTATPIDSDELTAALDADTRSYFQILAAGADRGTRGRGRDLRALLRTLEPTAQQLRPLTAELAARRREIRRLVHNLALLAAATESKDRELARLVVSAEQTLETVAAQEAPLRASLTRLPGTLHAVRGSLTSATALSRELGPTLTALTPTVRRLPDTLEAAQPLLDEAGPILRERLRPLVREAQPLARDLGPATHDLAEVTPALHRSFEILTYVVNELGHNPAGDDEGYLFWLAWFAHNGASLASTGDAHGAVARGLGILDCGTLAQLSPLVELLVGPIPVC